MKYKLALTLTLLAALIINSCGDKITRPHENTFQGASVYLDDVTIHGMNPATETNEQILANGDMESWTEIDSVTYSLDDWQTDIDSITVERDTLIKHDGQFSAKLTWTSTIDQTFLSEPIAIVPDSVYTCSLYVYDDANTGMAQIIIQWNNGQKFTITNSSNGADWTLYTFSRIAPHDADSMQIGVSLQDVVSGLSDTLYIQLNPAWDDSTGYSFNNPGKLIVGRDTYIYVCDTGNDRIVRLDAAGTEYESYSVPHPTGVTQDELLRLLVTNGTNNIYKIDVGPDAVNSDAVICYSGSRAVDSTLIFDEFPNFVFTDISALPGAGKIYLACGYDPMMDATGQVFAFQNFVTIAANTDTLIDGATRETGNIILDPVIDYGTGVGYADHPNGLTAFTRSSNLYLLTTQDSSSFKTQMMSYYENEYYHIEFFQPSIIPGGDNDIYTTSYRWIVPNAATIDSSGNIYVITSPDTLSNPAQYSAYKFDPTGHIKEEWGLYGSGVGEMKFPRGIAYDNFADRRTIYISDSGNNRILRFKLSTDIER
jgi:hypothetical protein